MRRLNFLCCGFVFALVLAPAAALLLARCAWDVAESMYQWLNDPC